MFKINLITYLYINNMFVSRQTLNLIIYFVFHTYIQLKSEINVITYSIRIIHEKQDQMFVLWTKGEKYLSIPSVNFFFIPTDILVLLNGLLFGKFMIREQYVILWNVTSVDIEIVSIHFLWYLLCTISAIYYVSWWIWIIKIS